MIVFAQLSYGMKGPEQLVAFYVIVTVLCCATWALIRWLFAGPVRPDPWDDQVATQLAQDDCPPVCHHCLTLHDLSTHFCPNCGAAVGTYTNLLPFPYLFSIGHTLRVGTTEHFKRSPLTIAGFFLFATVEYTIFAPIYWFRFFQNLRQPDPASTAAPDDHPSNSPAGGPG